MVLVRQHGKAHLVVVGPWTTAGVVSYTADAELLWIKFKLGAFMPQLPVKSFRDQETILPGAAHNSFWLNGSAHRLPDFDNVEPFVGRLVRDDVLVFDPLVGTALQDQLPAIASRTLRHRFVRATGLSRSHIRQVERAQQAAALLRQGTSIPDTVYELGYFDQSHLTRALKRFIGKTPAQQLMGGRVQE